MCVFWNVTTLLWAGCCLPWPQNIYIKRAGNILVVVSPCSQLPNLIMLLLTLFFLTRLISKWGWGISWGTLNKSNFLCQQKKVCFLAYFLMSMTPKNRHSVKKDEHLFFKSLKCMQVWHFPWIYECMKFCQMTKKDCRGHIFVACNFFLSTFYKCCKTHNPIPILSYAGIRCW